MATKTDAERRERFETPSGIELPVDFNPENTEPVDYKKDLGAPGEFPFTRGIYPNMYRGRFWTMRQYAGYASSEESNARYKYLRPRYHRLSVAFDHLPKSASDDPSRRQVWERWAWLHSLEDMLRLFEDIPRQFHLDDDQRDRFHFAHLYRRARNRTPF